MSYLGLSIKYMGNFSCCVHVFVFTCLQINTGKLLNGYIGGADKLVVIIVTVR